MSQRPSRASLLVLACLALALGGCAGARLAGSSRPEVGATATRSSLATASCPNAVQRHGLIAFTTRGRLELVDLATCSATVLRSSGAAEPRFSPDGRWLAYSQLVNGNPTRPVVIPTAGGRPRSPLGGGITAWSWAPTGELLYGTTAGGSLVAASLPGSS